MVYQRSMCKTHSPVWNLNIRECALVKYSYTSAALAFFVPPCIMGASCLDREKTRHISERFHICGLRACLRTQGKEKKCRKKKPLAAIFQILNRHFSQKYFFFQRYFIFEEITSVENACFWGSTCSTHSKWYKHPLYLQVNRKTLTSTTAFAA